ncbi:hypothetical protein [Gemmata sp.]|uniref:hypothetical protein n=1 Tax=Gemmata sp. TaxID=1914242 RepID=UPI003F70A79F
MTRLAESVRPAESATIRLPEGSLTGLSPQRDIVIRFAREDQAREFLAVLETASRKLS